MLAGWYNFYALAGSAAATLAGLLFLVVTLAVGVSAPRNGVHAFLTPALVHFCGVLFQALILLTPWPSEAPAAIALGGLGLAGAAYTASFVVLIARQQFVALSAGDWLIYAGVPAVANLSAIAGAAGVWNHRPLAIFAVAASTVLLMMLGVYQAWDLTLWIVKNRNPSGGAEGAS